MMTPCYYCHATDGLSVYRRLNNDDYFSKCGTCGLVSLHQKHAIENLKDYYSKEYYTKEYTGRISDLDTFAYRFRIIDEFLPKAGRLLEIGAASGEFLFLLTEKGYSAIGVELSEKAAGEAKKNFNLPVYTGTLEEARFPDSSLEIVVGYHVLEHVEDPKKLVEEITQILIPGGYLLIEVPDIKSLDARISEKLRKTIFDYPNHIHLFPKKLLVELLEKSGFEIIAIRNSLSFFLVDMIRRCMSSLQRSTDFHVGKGLEPRLVAESIFKSITHDSFIIRILKYLLPGMQVTIVARKKV